MSVPSASPPAPEPSEHSLPLSSVAPASLAWLPLAPVARLAAAALAVLDRFNPRQPRLAGSLLLRPTGRGGLRQPLVPTPVPSLTAPPNYSFNRTRYGKPLGPCGALVYPAPHGPSALPQRAG